MTRTFRIAHSSYSRWQGGSAFAPHLVPKILDRRTLKKDHRILASLLERGMFVLDVGCGTGAITRGIAEAVWPGGFAVGVDRDADLIARAIARASAPPNLRFERAEASGLAYDRKFDVVSSARTLQWIADVPGAISRMARAAKPGGLLVVLDYNHSLSQWDPEPPGPFSTFYRAFLE